MTQEHSDAAFAEGQAVEVVGRFAERDSFTAAVEALLAAGFGRDDLSVLDTHESLSASGSPGEAWQETLGGLVGEINYVGPLTAAGLIAIATGPVGSAVAALMAAGISVAAVVELLDKLRATPHTESFARALEGGAILLWVSVADSEAAGKAEAILADAGAADIHRHVRPPVRS
ncbi:hypothetical protein HBA54_25530 [Pelagibius litoralis]|uniref:Uncharacterized protein n=1 Tax=Pelagibius litoralis TaxID=374515 RepID=A0A967F2G9_9PROT|nr:hypothetical protein [Pelagibius litoralis]NIA71966.1 hypothetical protein [Pelagibius litoralis]